MSLVHLSTLVAWKNAAAEEEWSNFEFYPDFSVYDLPPFTLHKLSRGGMLRPFNFKMTLFDIIRALFGDHL